MRTVNLHSAMRWVRAWLHRVNWRKRGRQGAAIAGSAALHFVFLICLLWHPQHSLRGTYGNSQGEDGASDGYDVGSLQLVKARSEDREIKDRARVENSTPNAGRQQAPVNAAEIAKANVVEPQTAPGGADDAVAQAAVDVGGGAPGAPDGDQSLLQQIARCLPVGERPSLRLAKLDLALDPSGNLSAVPRLNVDISQLSRDQVRAGNQIIQAVLQCGPYKLPQATTAMIELVPDFSAVRSDP